MIDRRLREAAGRLGDAPLETPGIEARAAVKRRAEGAGSGDTVCALARPRPAILAAVVAVVVGVGALVWSTNRSPGSETVTVGPATTAVTGSDASVTTGEPPFASTDDPGPYPYPPDLAAASGCSPGPGSLPDGRWVVIVPEAVADGAGTVSVDLVCAFVDDDLRLAGIDPSFDGVLIADEIPLARSVSVDPPWVDELATLGAAAPVVITIDDGRVVMVESVDRWVDDRPDQDS